MRIYKFLWIWGIFSFILWEVRHVLIESLSSLFGFIISIFQDESRYSLPFKYKFMTLSLLRSSKNILLSSSFQSGMYIFPTYQIPYEETRMISASYSVGCCPSTIYHTFGTSRFYSLKRKISIHKMCFLL